MPASFNIYLASTLHHRTYSRLIIALRPKLCLKLFAESWRRLLLVISSTFSIIIQIKIFKIIIIKIMMNFYSAISISSWSSTTLCVGLSMGCNEQFTIFWRNFFQMLSLSYYLWEVCRFLNQSKTLLKTSNDTLRSSCIM